MWHRLIIGWIERRVTAAMRESGDWTRQCPVAVVDRTRRTAWCWCIWNTGLTLGTDFRYPVLTDRFLTRHRTEKHASRVNANSTCSSSYDISDSVISLSCLHIEIQFLGLFRPFHQANIIDIDLSLTRTGNSRQMFHVLLVLAGLMI